jgi:hypothetical protein
MNCTADRDMVISLAGSAPAAQAMLIRTESADRTLSADAGEGWLTTRIVPRDSFLDAMAFSKGRFAVEAQGISPLYLPAWPEISRVIDDCR